MPFAWPGTLGWGGDLKIRSPWADLPAKWPSNLKEVPSISAPRAAPCPRFRIGSQFRSGKSTTREGNQVDQPGWRRGIQDHREQLDRSTGHSPALRRVGEKILWKESLVVLCQSKTYPAPGAKAVFRNLPVTLQPGQKVSGIVNPCPRRPELAQGWIPCLLPNLPRERSSTQSFYYMSRHHDAVPN